MQGFLPVSMRDLTNSAPEGSRAGWEDVGGLTDIRKSIKEVHLFLWPEPNVFLNFRISIFRAN